MKNKIIITLLIAIFLLEVLLFKCVSKKYTYSDFVILKNYLLGNITFDENDIKYYDLNNDNEVDISDLLIMKDKIKEAK